MLEALVAQNLLGQNGIVYEINWRGLLVNERFLSNTAIFHNQKKIITSDFNIDTTTTVNILNVIFSTDSVRLNTNIDGITYAISAPNDIGLLLNSDKIELVNGLINEVKSQKPNLKNTYEYSSQNFISDTIQVKSDSKNELLFQVKILNALDSLPICAMQYPQASVINAFRDTLSCDGIYPLKMVFHEYGQKRDTLDTTVSAFIKSSGTSEWICWTIIENDNLVILLEHPVLRFNHMLYITPMISNQLKYWLVDIHSYIPSYNVADIYSTFSQNNNAETIEIK